jgi:release factor glutamine methyltransferase
MNPNQTDSFHYKDLQIQLNQQVYNPAEDTFLLLKTIQYSKKDSILEIGTGCGIIALSCSQNGAQIIATDINPNALTLTAQNIKNNQKHLNGYIHLVRGNHLDIIKINQTFDIIIFNPPYLPTTTKEKISGWINYAYDGGKNGLKEIKPFLKNLYHHLTDNGTCYITASSLQDTNKLIKTLDKTKLQYEIKKQQLIGDEYLQIYQLKKP